MNISWRLWLAVAATVIFQQVVTMVTGWYFWWVWIGSFPIMVWLAVLCVRAEEEAAMERYAKRRQRQELDEAYLRWRQEFEHVEVVHDRHH